jgi:hypothetical protein
VSFLCAIFAVMPTYGSDRRCVSPDVSDLRRQFAPQAMDGLSGKWILSGNFPVIYFAHVGHSAHTPYLLYRVRHDCFLPASAHSAY